MERLFFSFNDFLREKFGVRLHRLSLDVGFSCPNIDGRLSKEGCFYCNNRAFSYFTGRRRISLEEQITQSMEYCRKRFKARKFIAYFQSFTGTYGDVETLKEKFEVIRKFPDIVGLAISTRPDCVDKEKIELIESFTEEYMVWIEYGLQSANNSTLSLINRNHTYEDFLEAVELTRGRGIFIGVHIILGLPQETREDMLNTARAISNLPLSGIKFHCLHILRDTELSRWYKEAKVRLLSLQEYVDILCDFLEFIPQDWVILRLVSEASPDYLIAPFWINEKQKVLKKIKEELIHRGSFQGKKCSYSCKE